MICGCSRRTCETWAVVRVHRISVVPLVGRTLTKLCHSTSNSSLTALPLFSLPVALTAGAGRLCCPSATKSVLDSCRLPLVATCNCVQSDSRSSLAGMLSNATRVCRSSVGRCASVVDGSASMPNTTCCRERERYASWRDITAIRRSLEHPVMRRNAELPLCVTLLKKGLLTAVPQVHAVPSLLRRSSLGVLPGLCRIRRDSCSGRVPVPCVQSQNADQHCAEAPAQPALVFA